jgi:glycosyltransferase involved in cell wall biosynthesis
MLLQKFRNDVLARIPEAELWMVCEERVEGPGVRWFGRVSEVVLAELYRKAWVFCLPSSYEGFGIPYVEAMASGTAVVATPNPGAREVTAYGYYGLLAEERDLGAQLAGLILDSSRRKRMESRGLRRAQEFGWDRVCGRYEDLYRGEAAQIHDHQLYKPLGTGE